MAYKRIDSLDVTFADSSARPKLKVKEKREHLNGDKAEKGTGEKRIYCGHDEKRLDDFFCFNEAPEFFIQKDDLIEYFSLVKNDLSKLSRTYGAGKKSIEDLFDKYEDKLNSLDQDRLYLKFSKTYDSQERYYIVLPRKSKQNDIYHNNWDYLRDICIPRVTRLLFIKLNDDNTGQVSIYIKPVYGRIQLPSNARIGQGKFRMKVTQRYPECVVTKANENYILVACHIKGYADCSSIQKYDPYNGFTMTPTIHKLFDLGYITFNDSGMLIFSDAFSDHDKEAFHLKNANIVIDIDEKTKPYLKWHNDHTFIRLSKSIQIK